MYQLIITEFLKLKRQSIIWIGIIAVFIAAILAALQSNSNDGSVTYEVFYNNVIWNNFSLAFPFMIVLIGGYLINREYTDQTLKTMLTVPVSFRKMLIGKMMAIGILTLVFGVASFIFSIFLSSIFGFEGYSVPILLKALYQITVIGFCNYLAVLPIIAYFSRKKDRFFTGVGFAFFYGFCGIFVAGRNLTDFYPITSGLGLVHYTNVDTTAYNPIIGISSLILMVVLTFLIIISFPNYEKVMAGPENKKKEARKTKQV
ncbi:ABC transporter permease [Salicibibacter cibi]|uniref:ABC transporter permease n=1 Tax=Salicibibacter cibi TaxID=2743001 RepID=A0A7T6ZDD7_9BACI|nr:ABC transporter permease [Salicibibacter cibi]QQK81465.1 ABC transporter permease [Salicibibacter cibi]